MEDRALTRELLALERQFWEKRSARDGGYRARATEEAALRLSWADWGAHLPPADDGAHALAIPHIAQFAPANLQALGPARE